MPDIRISLVNSNLNHTKEGEQAGNISPHHLPLSISRQQTESVFIRIVKIIKYVFPGVGNRTSIPKNKCKILVLNSWDKDMSSRAIRSRYIKISLVLLLCTCSCPILVFISVPKAHYPNATLRDGEMYSYGRRERTFWIGAHLTYTSPDSGADVYEWYKINRLVMVRQPCVEGYHDIFPMIDLAVFALDATSCVIAGPEDNYEPGTNGAIIYNLVYIRFEIFR